MKYAHETLNKDKVLVTEAVKQDGYSLKIAHESLKDKNIVVEAVKETKWAIKFADESLKQDKDILDVYNRWI